MSTTKRVLAMMTTIKYMYVELNTIRSFRLFGKIHNNRNGLERLGVSKKTSMCIYFFKHSFDANTTIRPNCNKIKVLISFILFVVLPFLIG